MLAVLPSVIHHSCNNYDNGYNIQFLIKRSKGAVIKLHDQIVVYGNVEF